MKAENIIFGPILFKCEVEQDSINKLKSLCNQDKKNLYAESLVGQNIVLTLKSIKKFYNLNLIFLKKIIIVISNVN